MSADQIRLWALVVARADGAPVTVAHVAAVAAAATGVDATGITVTLAKSPWESLYVSDRLAEDMEELTMTLGEGPSIDAAGDGPVLVADLDAGWCGLRWPAYGPAALRSGVHAVFALPLRIGGIHFGVLDLYRGPPGELRREQLADALILADTVCALLLDTADDATDATTTDAATGVGDGDGHRSEGIGLRHPEVHQATGMVVAQLRVSAAVALIRLRAYAYAHDRRLRDVAADVVRRQIRFQPDIDGSDGATPRTSDPEGE